jgi:hypothetical protein
MKIPIEEAKNYLLWFHARDCFHCAKEQLEEIINNVQNVTENRISSQFKNRLIAFYAIYGKPFKLSYGIGKLDKKYVPEEYLHYHELIIDYRDQLFVHNEIGARNAEINELMQKLTLFVDNKTYYWQINLLLPGIDVLNEYLKLINKMIDKSKYQVDKFNNRWQRDFSKLRGTFELDIGSNKIAELRKIN